MTISSEPNPEQTEPSTQNLPITPTIQDMKPWNPKDVCRWIQQRDRYLLRGKTLKNFTKADIGGRAFLAFSVANFKACGLSLAVAAALKGLADEVKQEGKFIPRA